MMFDIDQEERFHFILSHKKSLKNGYPEKQDADGFKYLFHAGQWRDEPGPFILRRFNDTGNLILFRNHDRIQLQYWNLYENTKAMYGVPGELNQVSWYQCTDPEFILSFLTFLFKDFIPKNSNINGYKISVSRNESSGFPVYSFFLYGDKND